MNKDGQTIALLTLSLGKADSENLNHYLFEWNDLSSWLKQMTLIPQLLEERANTIVSNFIRMGMLIE